ncbi:hypothetical protein [Streptomyces kronopolitis]|uniref:hypothetical protein n=1 Tax=Streptomyces kronopolitis TaxID=1612435 RepID=UPI003D968998
MPDATALDQATAVIEKAWGLPIDALESLAVRRPGDDPLLRAAALHLRSAWSSPTTRWPSTRTGCTP